MQRQIVPAQPDGGLVPFFNVPMNRFRSAVLVAFNGGAFVGGVAIPTAHELAQGQYTALPFLLNGLGLVVCGVLAHFLHDTGRVWGFTLTQALLTAWL